MLTARQLPVSKYHVGRHAVRVPLPGSIPAKAKESCYIDSVDVFRLVSVTSQIKLCK